MKSEGGGLRESSAPREEAREGSAKGAVSRKRRWWRYILYLLLLALVAELLLFAAVAVNARRLDSPMPADVLIVLGARVEMDGSPTPALQRRLDRALELYLKGQAPRIIVAGGQGSDEPMPEAEAMKAYLVAQGVPEADILPESASYNTRQSLANARGIMDELGAETAIIVTSDYHLWRSLSLGKDVGIEATGAGSQNALTFPVAVRNLMQETMSMNKYFAARYLGLGM